jgi:hypothetical protein
VSGFSLALGDAFPYRLSSRDRRPGRLDDGVPAPFGQDVPGFAEVHLVGFLGGDLDGPPFVYLGLPWRLYSATSRTCSGSSGWS